MISSFDDWTERPVGVRPAVSLPCHPVLDGRPTGAAQLRYNRVTPKSAAQVLVLCGPAPNYRT